MPKRSVQMKDGKLLTPEEQKEELIKFCSNAENDEQLIHGLVALAYRINQLRERGEEIKVKW